MVSIGTRDTKTGRARAGRVSKARLCEIAKLLLCEMAEVANETESDDTNATQYVEPKTFDEAWNHPDPEQRRKWREAIGKEFGDMGKLKV